MEDHSTEISEVETLQALMTIFQKLSPESRSKMIKTVSTFYEIESPQVNMSQSPAFTASSSHSSGHIADPTSEPVFSQDRTMSPKEFLLEKSPKTDVERVACLAYYLTHYRDTPHFKTIDISKLNTEAAQRKFSNAAKAVDNAARSELLVPSTKGNKQLGAFGEVFVQELPDRAAAREAVNKIKPKRKKQSRKAASSN